MSPPSPRGVMPPAKGALLKFIRFLGWGNRAVVTVKEVLTKFLAFVELVKAEGMPGAFT